MGHEGRGSQQVPLEFHDGWFGPAHGAGIHIHVTHIARMAAIRLGHHLDDAEVVHGLDTPMRVWDENGQSYMATYNELRDTSLGLAPQRQRPSRRELKTEPAIRRVFEFFYGCPFPSTWGRVVGPDGRPYELDGYAERIGVAFEYQGDPTHRADLCVMARDAWKVAECPKLGIKLFVIDEIPARLDRCGVEFRRLILERLVLGA